MKQKQLLILLLSFITLIASSKLSMADTTPMVTGHWSDKESVYWITQGLINQDHYHPDEEITKAEFMTLMGHVIHLQDEHKNILDTVEDMKWFAEYSNRDFDIHYLESLPNKSITREEAAALFFKLMQYDDAKDQTVLNQYSDGESVSHWAKNMFAAMIENQIIIGSEHVLRPLDPMTQAEAIVMLNRIRTSNPFEKISFEEGIPSFITNGDGGCKIDITHEGATDGEYALQATYGIADFPSVVFIPNIPWDWGKDTCLTLDVTNPTDHVQTFYIRVDDDVSADGGNHSTVSIASIQPHTTEKIYMGFNPNSLDLGMRNFPPTGAGRNIGYGWGEKSLNLNHITKVVFWMMYNKAEATLIFDNIQVLPDPSVDTSHLDGIMNAFGQYAKEDWDGKVKSVDDLLESKTKELEALEAGNDNLPPTSQYGGWLDGPNLGGTGYFRTEKYDGKWSIVDPEGYLFFATGLDIVRFADMDTWIDGRRNMFNPVPDPEGPLKQHYRKVGKVSRPPLGLEEGWVYNYYTANLEQKYGENYEEEWKDITIKRFKNWGFSTIGNWSEPRLFFGKGEENKFPYVANGWITGDHARLSSGNIFWAPVADAFDPVFKTSVHNMVDKLAAYGIGNDPWCMGIYVDNEIAWGSPNQPHTKYAVISSAFQKDANDKDSYAKRAFIEKLKETYENIDALNASWKTSFESWSSLEAPYEFSNDLNEGMIGDLSVLLTMLADKYFAIVDEALHGSMPNMLNLGCRLAQWGTSLEVQEACAKYVDIVSFNVYKKGVKGENWIYADVFDKPCIVGEFTFSTTARGMIATGVTASVDHADRGKQYQDYLRTVLENPYFVGCHWFQYVDQPLTGRAWDGENYNAGFVDMTDIPYPKLIEAAKEIHSQVYDIRYR